MSLMPTIVTVDRLVGASKNAPKIVINQQPYISDHKEGQKRQPYYSNIVKRVIAAFYVLIGKGMVVRYSQDMYKPSEIQTVTYEK